MEFLVKKRIVTFTKINCPFQPFRFLCRLFLLLFFFLFLFFICFSSHMVRFNVKFIYFVFFYNKTKPDQQVVPLPKRETRFTNQSDQEFDIDSGESGQSSWRYDGKLPPWVQLSGSGWA